MTGFPLHFQIGGTFGLIPYFYTLSVKQHIGDHIISGGTSQILGVKTICRGRMGMLDELIFCCGKHYFDLFFQSEQIKDCQR